MLTALETGSPVVSAHTVAALWKSSLPSPRELRTARRRLHLKAAFIGCVGVVGYWGLVFSGIALPLRLIAAAVLVVGVIATATSVMHDANHGAFSDSRWVNQLFGFSSDVLGMSSWLWKFKHNALHHGNTNIDGADTDIAQAPFARLAASQPWHWWHRGQHFYLWFLYGFMTIKNVIFGDLLNLARGSIGDRPLHPQRRRRASTIVPAVGGKMIHLGWALVIPLFFHPWWKVLLFYVGCSWVVGFVLAITFQLAHCVDAASFPDEGTPRRGDDFVTHQLATTVDVDSPMPVFGHAFRWLVGGLDHQVEHHLAPRLPHTLYPILARRFRAACLDVGVACRVHTGVWQAIRSHARWLKAMAQRPTAAGADALVGAGAGSIPAPLPSV